MTEWPYGSGEMVERVRAHDWAATSLGPIERWPDRLKSVVEMMLASPLVSSVTLTADRLLLYNDAAARLYGERHPAALGRPLPETFPDTYPIVAPLYDRVFAGESVEVHGQPLAVSAPDGGEVFDAHLTPVRAADGTIIGAHMVGLEVGSRDRAETALRKSEEERRPLIEQMNEGFCILEVILDDAGNGIDYRFLETNPAFVRQGGFDPAGRLMSEIAPIEPIWPAAYGRVATTGVPERIVDSAAAFGRTYEVYAFRIGAAADRRIAVFFSDVTARTRAEAALQESEERQRFLLELTDTLRPLTQGGEVEREATRLLGEHLKADRCFLSPVYEDGSGMCVREEYLRSDASSVLGDYTFAQFGDFVGPELHAGRILAVEDVDALTGLSPAERESYATTGIGAYLLIPLVRDGRLAAFLTINHQTPRAWSDADKAVARQAADRLWTARERARAEAELRESEARLTAAFESVPVGVAVVDMSGVATLSNAKYRRFLPAGIVPSRDPARGARWRAWDAEGLSLAPQNFPAARAMRGETIVPGQEMLYTDDDGQEIWTSVATAPTRDDQGRVTGLVTAIADIDVAKRTTEALRESEERQAVLLQLSDAQRMVGDPAELRRMAVRAIGEQLGLARVYFFDVERDEEGWSHIIEPGYRRDPDALDFVGRHSLKDFGSWMFEGFERGEVIAVSDTETAPSLTAEERSSYRAVGVTAFINVPLLREGEYAAGIGAHTTEPHAWTQAEIDLIREVAARTWAATERVRAETALRDSEARFRQFSDASTNVLWIRDAETLEMMFASPAFDAIYGIPGPDRGGDGNVRTWLRLIEPESRKTVVANFRRVRAGAPVEMEFRIRRASDGAPRWIHNSDFPLRDAAGKVRWLAGLGADITEAKEATDRQGVLVAELQHRTRNLIAVVRSLSDRTLGNAASLQDFGKRFRLRLAALSRVQGLLSHLAAGERVTFDELLRTELAAHGATDGMAHKVTLAGLVDVPLRSGTVQTFALALHELATNAVKYGALAAPDGHLFVEWHVEPSSGDDPPRLHVEWRETGVIMPEVGAPARGGGYGRELIERALPYQLKARTTYELGADGVRCTIAVPISRTAGEGAAGDE